MDMCQLSIGVSKRTKQDHFKVVKILSGLTVKPNRVLALKNFITLEIHCNF